MEFDLNQAMAVLERTPATLKTLLEGLPEAWTHENEGPDTWSPYDIIGHLIHGEKTDWIQRAQIILSDTDNKTFEPFDRFAQFKDSEGKSLTELLDTFEMLRFQNLKTLDAMNISSSDLDKEGVHPALGKATLRQLLSTWTIHDLGHINQISRVMAKQYKLQVGPWIEYLSVLHR